jgi:7-carboxy-7-deazaguanine synthase
MTYTVKEIFLTVQGEGANIGRPAVFIRFAGCNLWSGREEDRADATCKFCDTEFVGGAKWGATALAMSAMALLPRDNRFCVLTGGEPLLQVDPTLLRALRANGFQIAIETNGTQFVPSGIDWVCVSPKAGAPLVVDHAEELKLVFPQQGLDPSELASFPAAYHWLSPMAGPDLADNTAAAGAYCLAHPRWRLAIQAHKYWGVR